MALEDIAGAPVAGSDASHGALTNEEPLGNAPRAWRLGLACESHPDHAPAQVDCERGGRPRRGMGRRIVPARLPCCAWVRCRLSSFTLFLML